MSEDLTPFEKIERLLRGINQTRAKKLERDAIQWFIDKISQRSKKKNISVSQENFLKGKRGVSTPIVGQMFSFWYDPKHKKTLPYYDRFPMIMPFDISNDGKSFKAVNFHYLPPLIRLRLLRALFLTMNSKKLSRTAKAKISYKLLVSSAKFSLGRPAIKMYLLSHVRSRIVRIPPSEWHYSIMLPLDVFTKASKTRVFKDTVKALRNLRKRK